MDFMELKTNQLKSHYFVTVKAFFRSKSYLVCGPYFHYFYMRIRVWERCSKNGHTHTLISLTLLNINVIKL